MRFAGGGRPGRPLAAGAAATSDSNTGQAIHIRLQRRPHQNSCTNTPQGSEIKEQQLQQLLNMTASLEAATEREATQDFKQNGRFLRPHRKR